MRSVGHLSPTSTRIEKKEKRRTKRSNPRAVGARVAPPRRMPRHRCDYCETTLTHDSVRPCEFVSCARNPPELDPQIRPRFLSNFGLTLFRPPLPSETQQNARKQHNLGFKHLANVRNYYSQFQAQVDARDAPPVEASPAVAYQMQVSRVLQQQQQQMPPPQMPPPGYGGYPPPTGMAPVGAPMGAPMGVAPIGMQPMGRQPMGMAPRGQGHPPGPPPR